MTPGADQPAAMQTLHQLIAEVLQVPPASINDASSPETVTRWDSMANIMVVTALEERFQVQFTLADIMTMRTVADIKAALARYGVSCDH